MKIEKFRDIKEYEGLYQISNFGRVKSLGNNKTKKEKIMKLTKDDKGYLRVGIYKEKKYKIFQIHRLVAEAFIPNPNNYPCVNHKDENPSNNNVDNLEWCDYKYNVNYGTGIQRKVENTDYKEIGRKNSEKLLNRKDQSKSVLQFTLSGNFIKEWESTMECKRNGFNQGAISLCCNGKLKYHKGFIWKFK